MTTIEVKLNSDRTLDIKNRQFAGVQGDVASTQIKFDISDVTVASGTKWSLEWWYGGTKDSTVTLTPTNNILTATIPRGVAQAGGNVECYLHEDVYTTTGGTETLSYRACRYPLRLYFLNKPNENSNISIDEMLRDENGIYLTIVNLKTQITNTKTEIDGVVEGLQGDYAEFTEGVNDSITEMQGDIEEFDGSKEDRFVTGDGVEIVTEYDEDAEPYKVLRAKTKSNSGIVFDGDGDFKVDTDVIPSKDYVDNGLSGKVDKVSGKGLSTNDYTTAEKTKLYSIEEGAEANVQSDWNESDSSKDGFIKNKPQNLVQDSSYVHTDNNFNNDYKSKIETNEYNDIFNIRVEWDREHMPHFELIRIYFQYYESGRLTEDTASYNVKDIANGNVYLYKNTSDQWAMAVGTPPSSYHRLPMLIGHIATKTVNGESVKLFFRNGDDETQFDELNSEKADKKTWTELMALTTTTEDAVFQLDDISAGVDLNSYDEIEVIINLPSALTGRPHFNWYYGGSYSQDFVVGMNVSNCQYIVMRFKKYFGLWWAECIPSDTQSRLEGAYKSIYRDGTTNLVMANFVGARIFVSRGSPAVNDLPSGTKIRVRGYK